MFYKALNTIAIEDWEPSGISEYTDFPNLALSLRTGDGIVLFDWENDIRTATIRALGSVEEASEPALIVNITWKEVNFTITPGPQGFRHWRDKWIFNLVPSRVETYQLRQHFHDAFNDGHFLTTKIDDPYILRINVDPSMSSIIPQDGFVYLISDGEFYKIGKAVNLSRRKKQLERQLGKTLELLHSIQSHDYTRAEAKMHLQFREKRVRGEWFNLRAEDIAQFLEISEL
jgi:hypothetical protein